MDQWLNDFDAALKQHFGIDHLDAGLDAADIADLRALTPKEAALLFGEEQDLDRIDRGWFA